MKLQTIILAFLMSVVAACGNRGDLYISDAERIHQSKDSNESSRLQGRAIRYQKLEQQTSGLRPQIISLRQQGRKREASTREIKYRELRYEMGKIELECQQESKYGSF